MKRLVDITQGFDYTGGAAAPKVLIVSPPEPLQLGPSSEFPLMSPRTDEWRDIAPALRIVAQRPGAGFFDAASVASAKGGGDGIHLDAANTSAIGKALVPVARTILDL